MPYYNLAIIDKHQSLHTVAKDRAEAFAHFAKNLGHEITDKDTGDVAPYLLDEFERVPHWINPTIPVFRR